MIRIGYGPGAFDLFNIGHLKNSAAGEGLPHRRRGRGHRDDVRRSDRKRRRELLQVFLKFDFKIK
jgi:hypothetical protein